MQELAPYEAKAQQAFNKISADSKGAAYQSWLGFYNSSARKLKWSSAQLVQQANLFSATIGESVGSVQSYAWIISSFLCKVMSHLALRMYGSEMIVVLIHASIYKPTLDVLYMCVHSSVMQILTMTVLQAAPRLQLSRSPLWARWG